MGCYFPHAGCTTTKPTPPHTRTGNKTWTRTYTQGHGVTCICRVSPVWAVRTPASQDYETYHCSHLTWILGTEERIHPESKKLHRKARAAQIFTINSHSEVHLCLWMEFYNQGVSFHLRWWKDFHVDLSVIALYLQTVVPVTSLHLKPKRQHIHWACRTS